MIRQNSRVRRKTTGRLVSNAATLRCGELSPPSPIPLFLSVTHHRPSLVRQVGPFGLAFSLRSSLSVRSSTPNQRPAALAGRPRAGRLEQRASEMGGGRLRQRRGREGVPGRCSHRPGRAGGLGAVTSGGAAAGGAEPDPETRRRISQRRRRSEISFRLIEQLTAPCSNSASDREVHNDAHAVSRCGDRDLVG